MTLHIGEPVIYEGQRHVVKRVGDADPVGHVVIEDEDGFAFEVPVQDVSPMGYTATVGSDGYVRDIDDFIENREGDPAFNGAFNRW